MGGGLREAAAEGPVISGTQRRAVSGQGDVQTLRTFLRSFLIGITLRGHSDNRFAAVFRRLYIRIPVGF